MSLHSSSKIVIIGAGAFGLSTALHLLKRGYTNIHIFDSQPLHETHYSPDRGAVGASCDNNKIIRASYGNRKLYQDLAFKAMSEWERWNDELKNTNAEDLPPLLDPNIPLWHNCGFARLSANGLERSEIDTQRSFPDDIRGTQYRVSDVQRRQEALRDGIPGTKVDPFGRLGKGLPMDGVLDMTAGYVLADRACAWALHLCMRSACVKTYFGPDYGLHSLMKTGVRASGIVTTGFERHTADFIVIACGGWTPSLLPEAEDILETTSGSVLSIQLPREREDLWDKYSEENFPVWSWHMGSYQREKGNVAGLYGLPRTPDGIVKIGFRGAKWTNFTTYNSKGELLSFPETSIEKIPSEAMRVIRTFCAEHLPDLLSLDLSDCRLCWYTDSIDNSFLIDRVPRAEALVVASGGSGHGFKFLPLLGEHIVDVMEGKQTEYTDLFQWRNSPQQDKNGLEEGSVGWRTLDKQRLVGNEVWRLPLSRL